MHYLAERQGFGKFFALVLAIFLVITVRAFFDTLFLFVVIFVFFWALRETVVSPGHKKLRVRIRTAIVAHKFIKFFILEWCFVTVFITDKIVNFMVFPLRVRTVLVAHRFTVLVV